MVHGYRGYRYWEASIYNELLCARELGNLRDPFIVTIINSDQTVGHISLKISSLCFLFLRCGGNITCKVTERKQHSKELPQGGLEIPYTLIFERYYQG